MFTTQEAVNAEIAYRRELMKGAYRVRTAVNPRPKRVQIRTQIRSYLHTLDRAVGRRSLRS
jgi:hypothetical protein